MATTTNYGWTTPDDTALVKDGAAAIRTLGSSIDTSLNTALGTKKAGLVLLNTTSFSAVSSFSLPASTFTSTYNDYLILVNFTGASANMTLTTRMRSAGSDFTSAAYDRGGVLNAMNSATLTALNATSQTSWGMGEVNGTYPVYSQFEIVLKSPQTTNAFKSVFVRGTYVSSSGFGTSFMSNNAVSSATQFDSASVIASTGNFTGNYSVYGFNK